MLITTENIESIYQVKVYTDSSLKNINGSSYVSFGYIIESQIFNINISDYMIQEGTISYGEMNAIYLAILKLEELLFLGIIPHNSNIILFSDSEFCVNSLTKWIYGWMKRRDENGYYIKSTGGYVAYQYLLDNIISCIIRSNMKINIFHTYGHVNDFNKVKKLQSKLRSDGLNMNRSMVKEVGSYNQLVDINSRNNFKNFAEGVSIPFLEFENKLDNEDIKEYRRLTKKI